MDTAGDLILQETTVTGGVISTFSGGGGIFNDGTLTLTNSTVTLSSSTVSGPSAAARGGGIFNSYSGTLTLTNSTVSGNSADIRGGGVYSFGTLILVNSTVSGNSAGYGGGVSNSRTLTLTNSTVSGNSAGIRGGGVHNYGTLTLTSSTVSGNMGGSQGPEVYNFTADGSGTVNTGDFNLFGYDGSSGVMGFTPGVTNIVPSVPLSAILNPALADNGGPTRTHALVSGSPAIDAILRSCGPDPGLMRTVLFGSERIDELGAAGRV